MFETNHTVKIKGKINYTVWSEWILCPNCNTEFTLYNETVDYESGSVSEKFNCSNCDSELEKADCEKVKTKYYDTFLRTTISKIKYVPVLINYSLGTKRNEKTPDLDDLLRIGKIEAEAITSWIPSDFIVKGDKSSDVVGYSWTALIRIPPTNHVLHSHLAVLCFVGKGSWNTTEKRWHIGWRAGGNRVKRFRSFANGISWARRAFIIGAVC